jgi:Heavy metal binding domain
MKKVIPLFVFVGLLLLSVSSLQAQKKQTSEEETYYVCPMHPDVTSETSARCAKCGMPMMKSRRPEEAEYDVQIHTLPAVVKPGQPFILTFDITHPKSGTPIWDFNIFHDMPFHLFVVSQDLDYFAHIHPKQGKDHRFSIETSVPKAGAYFVYCDIFPVNGLPHVIQRSLVTEGFKGDLFAQRARLKPDRSLTKSVSGMRLELTVSPSAPVGGKNVTLRYRVVNEMTGEPETVLQPYLGAWGHTLILSEDGRDYVHSHPSEVISDGADRAQTRGGPDIAFEAFLPRAGRYKIWSQFQKNNEVVTVSFTIEAKGY